MTIKENKVEEVHILVRVDSELTKRTETERLRNNLASWSAILLTYPLVVLLGLNISNSVWLPLIVVTALLLLSIPLIWRFGLFGRLKRDRELPNDLAEALSKELPVAIDSAVARRLLQGHDIRDGALFTGVSHQNRVLKMNRRSDGSTVEYGIGRPIYQEHYISS